MLMPIGTGERLGKMRKRVQESHQAEAFGSMESARQYADTAEKSMVQYRRFLKELKTLGTRGRYLEDRSGPRSTCGHNRPSRSGCSDHRS